MAKATHSLSVEKRGRLKTALNEEVESYNKPTSSEYLFGENMNEIGQKELQTVIEFRKYQIEE